MFILKIAMLKKTRIKYPTFSFKDWIWFWSQHYNTSPLTVAVNLTGVFIFNMSSSVLFMYGSNSVIFKTFTIWSYLWFFSVSKLVNIRIRFLIYMRRKAIILSAFLLDQTLKGNSGKWTNAARVICVKSSFWYYISMY